MAIDYTKRPKASQPADPPADPPAEPAAQPAAQSARLAKTPQEAQPSRAQPSSISLTKAAPRVNLAKGGDGQGAMRVNLNWSAAKPSGGGFLAKLAGGGQVDLDIGCLWELADGTKGVIQALGNTFGSLSAPPYIELKGDDRSGQNLGGENMHVDLSKPERFKRILVFAMIYQGAPNWAAVDGVVTLFPTAGPQVEVRLDSAENKARICAVALLESDGRSMSVQREVKYVQGNQMDLDKMYGWGLEWQRGRK